MNRSLGIVKSLNWPDISSYGVLSEKVDGGLKIWLDREGQQFFDPYRILALDDEDRSFDYLLHKFDEQLNPTLKKWDLNTDGIINIKKGFSFTLIDDEAPKISEKPCPNKKLYMNRREFYVEVGQAKIFFCYMFSSKLLYPKR